MLCSRNLLGIPLRKLGEDVKDEEYHDPFNAEELAQFDEKMRQYYLGRRYNQQNATWTDSVKGMLPGMTGNATGIIAYLKEQGFEFF